MNTSALAWIMFYIAAALLGIFAALAYLVFRKTEGKRK